MRYIFSIFVLTVVFQAEVFCSSSLAANRSPNIVFILADDLGYADIGCYGSKTNQTPHLDKLAKGGMRFTDFHSNGPMCSPTRAAFLTGRYQNRFGRRFESALNGAIREPGLPLSTMTIAKALRKSGYATGIFGKWHLGYESPFLPTNMGFDEFRGLVSGDGDYHTQVDRSGNEDWWKGSSIVMEKGYTTDLITRHSIDFIEKNQDKPFFLFIPHLAIHFPWQGPQDPPHRQAGKSYMKDKWCVIPNRSNVSPHIKAMVERLDDSIGEIVTTLEKLKLTDNTLIVFSSDNGGYSNYAGGFKQISDMTPLRGQKTDIYEGGHRVPTIFFWPGKITPSVCHSTAMTMDLFPTFAALAGAKTDNLDGVDLQSVIIENQALPERSLFWRMKSKKAVRKGVWKLCINGRTPAELFNLREDIGENHNLSKENPALVEELTQALSIWEKDVDQSAQNSMK